MKIKNDKTKNGIKKTAALIILALILCLCFLFASFSALTNQYKTNIAYSSAYHLIEINRQGKTNISAFLQKEQNLAKDIAYEIENGEFSSADELFSYMGFHQEIWGEDDIYVYTENGLCVNRNKVVQNNGSASELAFETIQNKELFRLVKSQAEYAISVNTSLKIRGSKIVALSVVHNLDTLIDDMGIESFEGAGSIYLTRQNGVKICSSGGENVKSVYNVLSLFNDGSLSSIDGNEKDINTTMANGTEGAFLFSADKMPQNYVIATPVSFMGETLYLFNIVPQNVVNRTMNEFTRNIILLSALVIVLFALLFIFYLWKSYRYDEGINSRDRLFDILVSETKNAFMLLETGSEKPIYISSNMNDILKEEINGIEKHGDGFCLLGKKNENGTVLSLINESLSDWNGKQEFLSGYLPYGTKNKQGYLSLSIYPVASKEGEFVGIVQDVTPEYKREQSLREALTLADSANRAKTQFLSSISHDIRTPLNAIINMTRFLQQDMSNEKAAGEEIQIIRDSSEHLLKLINNVLDLSRIESGKMSFTNTPFNINDTLEQVCGIVRPLCSDKKQNFIFDANIMHPRLIGDSLRLNQILINILNNAVKFTPENGTISFKVTELESIKSESAPFCFEIADNGIGIPSDKLEAIFDPFSRVENKAVHDTEGSGLGLAITKNFINALGGEIKVKSTVGKGSVFSVELNYTVDYSDTAYNRQVYDEKRLNSRFDGKRAMLAEDNAINVEIAAMILKKWGFTIENAKNGSIAVEMFEKHDENYYDIVYMDIQMPVMDGYEATRRIRLLNKKYAKTVPIVAMTANAFAEDVEKARISGMNAHIAKPIDVGELHRVTDRLINVEEE